ncbi:MAG: 6-bladed beta-propeller [Acidobacteriota bacterium]|nr:6-bladed beta-propeller [Acidobacteriota bacterium]
MEPIYPELVAVTTKGNGFILDTAEQQIIAFNASGKLTKRFGGQGDGPGEFRRASEIYIVDDRLFVTEWNKAHIFDERGTYLKTVQHDMNTPRKVVKGWIFRVANYDRSQQGTYDRLVWRNEQLAEEHHIASWPAEWGRIYGEGKTILVNPIRDRTHLAFSPDGHYVAIRPQGLSELRIFNVMTRKTRILRLNLPVLPFPIEYADRKFVEIEQLVLQRGGRAAKDYPPTLPAVTGIVWTSEDHIAIYQAVPDTAIKNVLFFNRRGNPAKPVYGPEVLRFIARLEADCAYVCVFNAEAEQAGLQKVGREDLTTLLQKTQTAVKRWQQQQ